MGYERLEKSLIDFIKEEQAKLGFFREDIRLYYPLSSLNHFFDSQDNQAEMLMKLSRLPKSMTEKLGNIEVSAKNNRFCIHIPEQGVLYVKENTGNNEFIKKLADLLQKSECTIQNILNLFKEEWSQVEFQEMHNGEFDCLIRFIDKPDDSYYYCFHDEGCHIIYHRFLPQDYADFDF